MYHQIIGGGFRKWNFLHEYQNLYKKCSFIQNNALGTYKKHHSYIFIFKTNNADVLLGKFPRTHTTTLYDDFLSK